MNPKNELESAVDGSPRIALRERAAAALLAFAAGDALGWPQEMRANTSAKGLQPSSQFRPWTRNGGGRFRPHLEKIDAGEYSDDTQMTFAVGRARLTGAGWTECLAHRELPFFQLYNRGAGRAMLRACRAWRSGRAPWSLQDATERAAYFVAGANGVAMRALPHVIWNASGGSQTSLSNDTFRDGILTHGHPRALLGAAVFAHAAFLLIRLQGVLDYGDLIRRTIAAETHWAQRAFVSRADWVSAYETSGASIAADWQQTVLELRDLLTIAQAGLAKGALVDDREVLANLGCFGKFKGAGTTTAVAAIYLASRYAAQPIGGVLAAGFAEGADTDTLAAMTAGLLGLLHGRTWMPSEWLRVQDAQALEQLAERLVENTISGSWRPFDEREVTRFLNSLEPGRVVSVDGDLVGKVVQVAQAEHRGVVAAKMWKLALQDGQTLHVKEYVTKTPKAQTVESIDTAVLPERIQSVRRPKAKLRGVMLPAREPERLARFYSLLLATTAKAGAEGRLCVGMIEVVPAGRGNIDAGKDAVRPALVFEAGDLDATTEQILSTGGTESERAGDASDHQWARFLDPEGNAFEVIEVQPKRR